MSLLDLIFPKSCVGCQKFGGYLCTDCFSFLSFSERGFCTVCQRPAIDGLTHPGCFTRFEIDGVFSSLNYKGIVKKLVYRFKYKPYLLDIAGLLGELFYEGIIQKEPFINLLNEKSLFAPIPLHKKRLQSRGYNQSQVLAKGLSEKLRAGFSLNGSRKPKFSDISDILERVKETKAQFGLSQKDRIDNVREAFAVKKNYLDNLKNAPVVFLIDDIVTTGSTFREAAKVLKKAGVKKVYGVALAHGQ